MMGYKLPRTRQTYAINAMLFKDVYREIAANAHNHQGDKKLIAARQFCDEEDACQRCLHHTGHHTSHAHQSKILLGNINTQLIVIPNASKKESRKAANKQRWRKGSATTSSSIGGRCGKNLKQYDQAHIENKVFAMSIKHRPIHHLPPIGHGFATQEDIDLVITLAIK